MDCFFFNLWTKLIRSRRFSYLLAIIDEHRAEALVDGNIRDARAHKACAYHGNFAGKIKL